MGSARFQWITYSRAGVGNHCPIRFDVVGMVVTWGAQTSIAIFFLVFRCCERNNITGGPPDKLLF